VIRPGSEWGTPTDEVPAASVAGDDHALSEWIDRRGPHTPTPLLRFTPRGSDLARAVGLQSTAPDRDQPPRGIALLLDAMATDAGTAVNGVVVGPLPDRLRPWHRRRRMTVIVDGREVFAGRATSVVVMNGEYLGTADLVPRGHPGDGRLEIQVYALAAGERAGMRRRLPLGTHVPHPRITATSGREVVVRTARPVSVTLDRHAAGSTAELTVRVRPGAFRLLV
jgi:hypothetical protein